MSHPDSNAAHNQAQLPVPGPSNPGHTASYLLQARQRLRNRENRLDHDCPAAHRREKQPVREAQASTRQPFPFDHKHKHNRPILPDRVDKLDGGGAVWGSFHHEGPYDCAYRERNIRKGYAPVDALKESNAATLRSTPPIFIMESLLCQKPLHGCATYPPGSVDYDGVVYDYEQFEMQMLDKQNYSMMPKDKRCPKVELPPEQRMFKDEGNPNGLTWFWDWFRAFRKKRKERKKQKDVELETFDLQKDEGSGMKSN